jgi:hypothetical protein
MKEQDLIDLGFTKEVDEDFYYYVYDFASRKSFISEKGLSLITQANDEVINNEWVVEFFDLNPSIALTDKESVETLIKIINKTK